MPSRQGWCPWQVRRRAPMQPRARVWTVPNAAQLPRGCSASRSSCGWSWAPRRTAGRWRCSWSPASPTSSTAGWPASSTSSRWSARSSTPSPTGSTSSPSWSAWRCATSSRGGWRSRCPLRDALMWGLVPLLRTRGYSALPVHFLGKAATFNLLYAFPLLLLGDGDGHGRHAGAGLRLGVRLLGDRPVLVGRRPLRLAGTQAAGHHRAAPGAADGLTPTPPSDATPGPTARAAGPGADAAAHPDHPAVPRRGLPARGRAARRRRAPAAAEARPRRTAAVVVAVFGLLVATAAVQTSRNADVDSGQPRDPDRAGSRPRARPPGRAAGAGRDPARAGSRRSSGRPAALTDEQQAGRRRAAPPRRCAPASSRSPARASG